MSEVWILNSLSGYLHFKLSDTNSYLLGWVFADYFLTGEGTSVEMPTKILTLSAYKSLSLGGWMA